MKKIVFSSVFIILFGAYIFSQRLNPPEVLPTASPVQVENTPSTPAVSEPPTPPVETQKKPLVSPSPVAKPVTKPAPTPVKPVGQYKDGSYTGVSADATYGNVQVKAIIKGGKITDVQFLDSPHTRDYSVQVNAMARPLLTQEAIQAQSAQVNGVSGATFSSGAFIQSLTSALAQAKN